MKKKEKEIDSTRCHPMGEPPLPLQTYFFKTSHSICPLHKSILLTSINVSVWCCVIIESVNFNVLLFSILSQIDHYFFYCRATTSLPCSDKIKFWFHFSKNVCTKNTNMYMETQYFSDDDKLMMIFQQLHTVTPHSGFAPLPWSNGEKERRTLLWIHRSFVFFFGFVVAFCRYQLQCDRLINESNKNAAKNHDHSHFICIQMNYE